MELTLEQKDELLRQYDRVLWAMAHRFQRKSSKGYIQGYNELEDLHSECVLVLLKHLNSCETMEEVHKLPVLDMINAMCRYVLTEQALSYPKRTTDFTKVIRSATPKICYEQIYANDLAGDLHDDSVVWEQTNDALARVKLASFCKSLPEMERQVIIQKLTGKKNCEIARRLGITNTAMTRIMQKLRKAYQEQVN